MKGTENLQHDWQCFYDCGNRWIEGKEERRKKIDFYFFFLPEVGGEGKREKSWGG